MKGTIEKPKVAKIAMSLLEHLFFDVILTLERSSGEEAVFGKQLLVKKCMSTIKEFILTHPYAIFSIEVLNSTTRDLEDPLLTVSFKNFIKSISDMAPIKYHIILDETYTTFTVYKSSPSGILLELKLS